MKQDKPKRTKIIKVPVTEEQYKDLKFYAKAKGMPLARYVRQHYIK
jgi:hypothetical protein